MQRDVPMMLQNAALEYRRLRAPRENHASLVDPPYTQIGTVIASNERLRASARCALHGRTLAELSEAGHRELIDAARKYVSTYRDVPTPAATERLLVAGHQPELYHPGVWCKSFVLDTLARQHGATAVNLIVDSDTMKRASLRVPRGPVDAPTVAEAPFDQPTPEIPYENRQIQDQATFAGFGEVAQKQLASLVPDPLLRSFWPKVVERSKHERRVGLCFAQARNQLEMDWGLSTLEVPQSQVCQLDTFLWMTAFLLSELPRFRRVYNASVAHYRQVNRIRSSNHPVPDLTQDDGWLEAPFWVWSDASPRRRRLFVRHSSTGLEITDRAGWQFAIPTTSSVDAAQVVERLRRLPAEGIKLRSRALVTTMFARLVLGDMFIHGIGGAKYDELTDLIIREFFDIEPPRYMLLSATLLLPIPHERVTPEDERGLEYQLRELAYHPEQHLDLSRLPAAARQQAGQLIAEKRRWIAVEQTKKNARERCRTIRGVNEQLQKLVTDQQARLVQLREQLTRAMAAEQILSSREYAFCLYPEQSLRDFMSMFQDFSA